MENGHSKHFHHNDDEREQFDPLERAEFVNTEMRKLNEAANQVKPCSEHAQGKSCVLPHVGDWICEAAPCDTLNGKILLSSNRTHNPIV